MTEAKARRIEERYRDNLRLLPSFTDGIYSQHDGRVAELAYGEHGHIGREGCGPAAVYNALRHIGEARVLPEVIRDMEKLSLPWLGARFGTKAFSLGRIFRLYGVPCEKCVSPTEFKGRLADSRVGIVCTWNPRFYGMHFFSVYYDKRGGAYYSANFRNTGKGFRRTAIDEISSLRFIAGYLLT